MKVRAADVWIDVWCYFLETTPASVRRFEEVLSSDEIERADRFRFPHLRSHFIVAHGVLRHLLSGYVDAAPGAIRFACGPQGKPEIDQPRADLRFNLSHSGDLAVCAVGTPRYLGIDVEKMRRVPDLQELANRFFSPEESNDLAAAPPGSTERSFFTCWTRKEAYIKAVGGGLSIPLDSFRVTILPEEDPRILRCNAFPVPAAEWNLVAFDPGDEYIAAIGYAGESAEICVHPPCRPEQLVHANPA